MAYSNRAYQPSVLELAREGNIRAIAYWLNGQLVPQGVYASIRPLRSNCLHITVEFDRIPERDRLVRFICHRLCKLNLDFIEGVKIAARFTDESQILWQQSVRLVTPARRRKQVSRSSSRSQTATKTSSVKQLLDQRVYLKLARSLLLSGSAVAAFVLGCLLSYNDTPTTPTIASANGQRPTTTLTTASKRPSTVRAALETVPVSQHQNLLDPADPAVTLMFGGDVTLSDAFEDLVGEDYNWAFADMKEYRQADVAMVNLENPLTRATTPLPDKQFNFKADPDAVEVLTNGGVDIVTLANNHAMDYEASGLIETLETLDQAGIYRIGAGRDVKEARRPEILEVKGQRIAYLGYYDADLHAADVDTAGTNSTHKDRIAEDIRAIRNQVDWIVVNYHWGEELAEYPADMQIQLAHHTIDAGADLVVGHHPHVLQGAEIYKGRPIAYSLGNFIFGGNSRSDYDTAVLKVALRDKQMKVEFLPVEVTQYQPRIVSGDRGEQILSQIRERSNLFSQPMPSTVILDAQKSEVVTPEESGVFSEPVPSPAVNPDETNVAPSPFTAPQPTTPDSFITAPDSGPNTSPTELPSDTSTPLNSQPSFAPETAPNPDSNWAPDSAPSNTSPNFSNPESAPGFPDSEPTDSWQPLPSEPTVTPFSQPTTAPFSEPTTAPSLDSTESTDGYTYPHREEPDDYWQPLTPDPAEIPDELAPSNEMSPSDELAPSDDASSDPSAPLNSQPAGEPFTEPADETPSLDSSPLNEDPSRPLNQDPASSPAPSDSLEPFTAPADTPANDLELEPSIAPTTAPDGQLEPFITNPTETPPTAPTTTPSLQQGNFSPEPVQTTPQPSESPSRRKQSLRERIAFLKR